jgi:hypothetical protein
MEQMTQEFGTVNGAEPVADGVAVVERFARSLPVALVPTPTREYRTHRKPRSRPGARSCQARCRFPSRYLCRCPARAS